jgi:hypothetical protein
VAIVAGIILLHNSSSADGRVVCNIVLLDWQVEDKVMVSRTWNNLGIHKFLKNLGAVSDVKPVLN